MERLGHNPLTSRRSPIYTRLPFHVPRRLRRALPASRLDRLERAVLPERRMRPCMIWHAAPGRQAKTIYSYTQGRI